MSPLTKPIWVAHAREFAASTNGRSLALAAAYRDERDIVTLLQIPTSKNTGRSILWSSRRLLIGRSQQVVSMKRASYASWASASQLR